MFSMFSMSLLALVLLFVVVALVSTGIAWCKSSGNRNGWWPVLLAVPLLFLFFVGTVRVQVTNQPPQESEARRHAESMHRLQAQQSQIVQHAEMLAAKAKKRIEAMDIHSLMDAADAPRIPLPPDPPASPELPAELSPADAASESSDHVTEPAEQAKAEAVAAVLASDESEAASAAQIVAEEVPAAEASGNTLKADADQEVAANDDEAANAVHAELNAEADAPASERIGAAPAASAAAKRPAWVDDPPKRVGHVWREVIETDQYATADECYRAADIYLQLATYDHLARLVGLRNHADGTRPNPMHHFNLADGFPDGRLGHLASMGIGIEYIRREIAKDEYLETSERSFGQMKKLYTLIEFPSGVDNELRARWDTYRRQERFAVVGAGAASVLGLLGISWGLLRFDTFTKGYYTKRLFLVVPAMIIALVALLALMVS
jgi:hypothetical protein